MLLPKPLSAVMTEDIRQFALKFPEGLRVEYKGALTDTVRRKVPAIISSFANSYGGILIIGINTEQGVPVEPIEGYDTPDREELSLTVQNLCIENINPPIFPRTRQIPSDVAGKAFLVVEVDESPEAPHAIENSRSVYIRTGDSQRPYDIGDIQTVERLLTRRKGIAVRKDELTAEAETLARRYVDLDAHPMLTVVVSTVYPSAPLTEREVAYAFLSGVGGFRDKVFRHPTGACALREVETASLVLWKLSVYGHLFTVELLRTAPGTAFQGGRGLSAEGEVYPFSWIVGSLRKVFQMASNFFESIHFVGQLQVDATLRNVANKVFAGGETFLVTKLSSVAPIVPASTVVTPLQLRTSECLCDVFYQLLWPFLPHEDSTTRGSADLFVQELLKRM
jgi:schlafen family protein